MQAENEMKKRTLIQLNGVSAAVYLTDLEVGGRRCRGWLCHPNGDRIEAIMIADLADAEARARALVAKGKL